MATDDHGGNPTDLSGVTFIGRPDDVGGSYHIRRNTGKVLGPFDVELILQMIRGRKLTGDEAVSTDRQSWAPILSVPDFSAAFRAAQGESGSRPAAATQSTQNPMPAPAVPRRTEMGMMNMPPIQPGLDPRGVRPEDDALSGVPGIRRLGQSPDGASADSELPMPEGFTHFPGSTDGALPFADAPPPLELGGSDDIPAMPAEGFSGTWTAVNEEQHTIEDPGFGKELAQLADGFNADLPRSAGGFADLPTAVHSDLPRSADPFDNLPQSAQGVSGLPQSAQRFDNLPQSAQGVSGLPTSAQGFAELPTSADPFGNLPGSTNLSNLPGSTDRTNLPGPTDRTNLPGPTFGRPNLPQSAASAPASTAQLPTGAGAGPAAGAPQFGTMAMTGLGHGTEVDATLPAGDLFGTKNELPASSRATGPSILDAMAQTDDIWSAPAAPTRQPVAAPSQPFGFQTDAMTPDLSGAGIQAPNLENDPFGGDPFAAGQAPQPFTDRQPSDPFAAVASPTAQQDDDFGDFFPGGQAGAPAEESVDELFVATDDDDHELVPPVAAKTRGSGKAWGLRIGLMAVLLAVLGGAAVLLTSIARGPGDTDPEVVVTPTTTRPVLAVELPPIETLRDGGYQTYQDYVDAARTAVGDRGTPNDRARFLLAASLLLSEHPDRSDLYAEMSRTASAMGDPSEAPDEDVSLVTLAHAAFLAVSNDEDAPAALEAARSGEYAAYGQLFTGIYAVQHFRGITFENAAPEPVAAADGSGDDAPAEGSGAAAEAEDAGTPEEPTTTIVDDEALEQANGEQAAPSIAPIRRELDPAAAAAFDAAIAADPELVAAYYWRGWSALAVGEPAEAQAFFEQALEKNAEHVGSDIGVATALLRQALLADADNRIQHVIDDLEGVSSSMQRSDTFEVAGEIAAARMQPEIAIESLLSALQANPVNRSALAELGDQFYHDGQFTRSVEFFTGMSDTDGIEDEVHLGLAKAYYGLEDYDAARSELDDAMRDFPSDGRLAYWMGRVYEAEAEFEIARQYFRQANQITPYDVRPLVRLAQLAERENKPGDALRLLSEASTVNDGNAVMANEIGEAYLRLGETNRAVTAFRDALEMDGSQPRARVNLTEYYLNSDQPQRALEQLQTMRDSGVESPRIRYLNARALQAQGENGRAVEELLVLLEADSDNPDYLFLLGRSHFEAGNYRAAREQFIKTLENSPGLTQAQYYIGRCDIELEGYNEAITSLTAASQRSDSGEYHYWLGVALERAEQPTQALTEFDRAITDDIAWSLENPEVFSKRGRLLFARGAARAAYRDLRTVLTLEPRHSEASWNLGRVHFQERAYQKAIDAIEYSLSIDPNQPEAHYVAALAYLRSEPARNAEAMRHLVAARDGGYGEREPELYQKLAYVYRDLNDRSAAADALESYVSATQLPYEEEREMLNEIRRLRGQR